MKQLIKISLSIIFFSTLLLGQTGCESFLDQQPLTDLSENAFWENESHAMLALTGLYEKSTVGLNGYNNELLIRGSMTDDSGFKHGSVGVIYSGYVREGDGQIVTGIWNRSYTTIFKTNYFLENIDRVEMDASKKAEFIAEARFLRAYEYFYLSTFYGYVPLITQVLTIEEANTQTQTSQKEIQEFAIQELTEVALDLPAERPSDEKGRILRAAAYGIKGRMLMTQKKWSDAAIAFKAAMDLGVHIIDPRFKELFIESGEDSKENILVTNCISGLYPNVQSQLNFHVEFYGGYSEVYLYQNFIDDFPMIDGMPIDESPLYDPEKPFDNRDPRLYASVMLPNYTEFRGEIYDPSLELSGLVGSTGYGYQKVLDEDYEGSLNSAGNDIIHMRYSEILLSYLESKLEAGDNITQDLLDETINKVRGRESVNIGFVTETDPAKLRRIVRTERRIEFSQEGLGFIRWWDIRRWGEYVERVNKKFYGMKLTDDPENYTKHPVEKTGKYRGHKIVLDKTGSISSKYELLPIPIFEININPTLQQNPGY